MIYAMKKKFIIIPLIICIVLLSACGTEKLMEEANAAVDSYNTAAAAYNENIRPYNDAIGQIETVNSDLQAVLDAAQDVINKGEEPYDPETLEALKTTLTDAGEAKVSVPETLAEVDMLAVPEDAKKDALESLIEQATTGAEEISSKTVPALPEIPDYTENISAVTEAQTTYENSIQSLKQITAPSDDFVMERLQRVDTITAMDAVTEDHDPNGQLNKQGGYIGCIYFTDTQVDRDELYIEDGKDNVIDVGTDGGGAIEIFATAEEAEVRNNYLAGFDGMGAFSSGSHYVEGSCIIRTSNYLNGTQQKELTEKITQALIAID